MKNPKKILLIPAIFFIALATLGLGVDLYNRYYRALSTPFLAFSMIFLLVSFFFSVKKQAAFLFLTLGTVVYILVFLSLGLWRISPRGVTVYYQSATFNSMTGRLSLARRYGLYPPPQGAYLSCHFEIKNWKSYLDSQPDLCSGFDESLRLIFSLHDQSTPSGEQREMQWNSFQVERKSLLGETLNRAALRVTYQVKAGWFRKKYQAEEIYQAFEKEINSDQNRVAETFLRDGQGRLKNFTESSLPNLSSEDLFATYNAEGILVDVPAIVEKSFVFPAKIDVSLLRRYPLPRKINIVGPK